MSTLHSYFFRAYEGKMSSVGLNFECRCRANFGLNVACRMKKWANVACRNKAFMGPNKTTCDGTYLSTTKLGDNVLGSVCPSVCLFISLRWLSVCL